MNLSIRIKLLLAMLIAALIPLIVVAAISFFTAENVIFNLQINQLDRVNQNQISRVSQFINTIDKKIKEVQIDPIVLKEIVNIEKYGNARESQDYQSARKALDSILQSMQRTSQLEDIYLADQNGKIVYASDAGHAWQYIGKPILKNLEWSKPLTQFGFSYSSVFLNTIKSGNYDFLVSAPLYDDQEKIYGSVIFEVSLLEIYSILHPRLSVGLTGESILLVKKNEDSALVLSPLRFNKFSVLETILKFDQGSQDGYVEFKDYRNKESIGIFGETPKMDFIILTMMNKEEMFSKIYALMYENDSIMLGAAFFVILVALLLSYSITRPLQSLAKAALNLTEKNLNVDIDPKLLLAKDEIGTLAKAFQKMIYELRNYYQSLQDLIKSVELGKDEAVSASKAKSNFLATMSHELRTPLNAIIGYSELLMEESEEQHLEGFSADLGKITNSAKQLLSLINTTLDFSKIEAGKIEIDLQKIEISPFVEMAADLVRQAIEKNGNIFEIICPNDIGEMTTDATRVRQSLLNLLSNASKFTTNGKVCLLVSRHLKEIHFTVSDTGIGITEEQLSKLFQPFTQAENSTTRKFGGTGLGLYLCKYFCEMLGGSLQVQSTYGKGSSFTMILPTDGKKGNLA